MIRVLLLQGKGSDLLVSYLTGQMEVDIFTAASPEDAYTLSLKKPVDVILAPAPDNDGSDSPDSSVLIRWHQEIRSKGKSTAFLTYTLQKSSVILTDISAGMTSLEPGIPAPRTLITILRQAAQKTLLERSFRDEYEIQRRIINTMPLACLRAESGIIMGTNPAMEVLSGYRGEDLDRKPVSDIIIRIEPAGTRWENAFLQDSSGEQVPVRVYKEEYPGGTGSDITLLFIEDRREARNLHAEIRETERICREKLWLSETLVLKIAPDGLITFANEAAHKCFGYAGQSLTGHHISLLLPPVPDPEPISPIQLFLGVANESEPTAIHIMEHLRCDRGKIYIAWTTRAFFSTSGDLTSLLCIGSDMTEQTPEGEGRISTHIWRDRVIEGTDILPEVFDAIVQACVEIGREGREGKPVGTAFLIGDRDAVMDRSRQLILNPFYGHPSEMLDVTRKDVRETLKEYALLDGAFVVSGDGMLEAAGRYITVDASQSSLPKGMGTRHSSTAAITSITRTVGLVVSESGGRVSVIKNGKIVKVIG
jgi:DNA integrity scanning protein DisA with diadenylate cyclase activity